MRELIKQSTRYLLVGGASATIELLLFSGLHYVVAMSIPVSNVIAIFLATCFNFLINRSWTFKVKRGFVRSMVLYVLLFLFNNLFSSFLITFLAGQGLNAVLAKLLTMVCIVCWNFVLYQKVIFKPEE